MSSVPAEDQILLSDGHTTLTEASQVASEMHELAESLANQCNDSDATVMSKGAAILGMLASRVEEMSEEIRKYKAWAASCDPSPPEARAPLASKDRTLSSLKRLVRGYVSLLESARERIIFHGGTCDTVEQMERGDPYLAEARAAILLAESAVETTRDVPNIELKDSSDAPCLWCGEPRQAHRLAAVHQGMFDPRMPAVCPQRVKTTLKQGE